jgi:hypothetical protein
MFGSDEGECGGNSTGWSADKTGANVQIVLWKRTDITRIVVVVEQ